MRFVLGPAGSGKTFRCVNEARQALAASPEGLPMILLAPKQGTYQLEQQLLATPSLAGYSRLSILSFESLTHLIFDRLGKPRPAVLSEEGRLMVLRSLLTKHRDKLKLFRASARLTGFAKELNQVLSELQRAGLDPAGLHRIAADRLDDEGLRLKLQDLALLLEQYLRWLEVHSLQDGEAMLKQAVECLGADSGGGFTLEALWGDGFSGFSKLELDLLASLLPRCQKATLTFCLEHPPAEKGSWLSHWSVIERSFRNCRTRFSTSGFEVNIEQICGGASENRFSKSPVLRHLQECWETPHPYCQSSKGGDSATSKSEHVSESVRLIACPDLEAEVTLAAREILGFVRAGARFRDVSVLVRNLEPYQPLVQRIFNRYEIPFFLDRRESACHHPLAELTRSALRVVAFDWQIEDWFAALKSGFVCVSEEAVDLLENEALARGWRGETWFRPVELREKARNAKDQERLERLARDLEEIRRLAVPPFEQFAIALSAVRNRPTGQELAVALRQLWATLRVEDQLRKWSILPPKQTGGLNPSVHETVWRQMDAWLENAALGFPHEPLSLREWLPILESGLAGLSVGVVPPVLDQVLVGAVDRSRTPEVKLAIVLGLNECVFPAKPQSGRLLSEADLLTLERHNVLLEAGLRNQLGRERYLAYIACTRARQKLVLTWADRDATGATLNPSSVVSHLRQLFPELQIEVLSLDLDWERIEHSTELVEKLSREHRIDTLLDLARADDFRPLWIPGFSGLVNSLEHVESSSPESALDPHLAARLYGPVLKTSVSRMEQFAACPFKFFVHSGLRAEERKTFELDIKEQGSFQHDVLAVFHQTLHAEGKRWRDITPADARALVARIAAGLLGSFREGLLEASEEARFTARVMTESLQDFVEILVRWMREQYQFDPVAVELPFGLEENGEPGWVLELGNGKCLELNGRIDRVDLYRIPKRNRGLCVIVDYKSSQKQLEPILVENGLQLQLLSYLNVLRQWPDPLVAFGIEHFDPVGVFYINLRGYYNRERNRNDALADPERARKLAYRHSGRFDISALPHLDSRPNPREGDQFNYRLKNNGEVFRRSREALPRDKFRALLKQSEKNLREMGQRIFAGHVEVGPYRKGLTTACDQCNYQAICRIDPWTHRFRALSPVPEDAAEESSGPGDGQI